MWKMRNADPEVVIVTDHYLRAFACVCLSVCVPVDMHAYASVCARMFVMMNLMICNQENNSDTEKRQKKKGRKILLFISSFYLYQINLQVDSRLQPENEKKMRLIDLWDTQDLLLHHGSHLDIGGGAILFDIENWSIDSKGSAIRS